jgi:hypothetical protein
MSPNAGRGVGGVAGSQPMSTVQLCTWSPKNFGDLTAIQALLKLSKLILQYNIKGNHHEGRLSPLEISSSLPDDLAIFMMYGDEDKHLQFARTQLVTFILRCRPS